MSVRTRFAPSPTGMLHVGGARTAILNWLMARHHGGRFVLRLEDTDRERNVEGAEAAILDDLLWLGLGWDEGPEVGGECGPYRQSERRQAYEDHLCWLLEHGRAFACTCPPAEEAGRGRARCDCARRIGGGPRPEGASVRFRVPDGEEVAWNDAVRGRIAYDAGDVEDFVLARADGTPTYNFAAAVDDGLMEITHVIRGADHLANTPKQLLLYRAFGWEPPVFAHVPLILGPDRQKLSKRHGAVSVGAFRERGVVPEALVNYLSLLAWSAPSGEEVLPPERLVEEFDLDRVRRSDAVFDPEKLRWLSSVYLERMDAETLVEAARPWIDPGRVPLRGEALEVAVETVRVGLSELAELEERLAPFAGPVGGEAEAARSRALADPEARAAVGAIREALERVDDWQPDALGSVIRDAGRSAGLKGRALFVPLRLALTGREHGPDLARVAAAMGRERTLALLAADDV